MDEMILMQNAEKYLSGDMQEAEKRKLEEYLDNNPKAATLFKEHIQFLKTLNSYGPIQSLRVELTQIEQGLKERKTMVFDEPKQTQGLLMSLWNKHKQALPAAVVISSILFLATVIIISVINSGNERKIKPLVEKLHQQEKKTRLIENKVNQLANSSVPTSVPKLEARFRATGFMVDAANTFIITNAHVVKEAKNNLIVENNRGEQFTAEAVCVDPETDLAVIKVTDSNFRKMPATPYTIKKNACDLGDAVFLLGYPKQEIVYGEGYISAMNGFDMDSAFYQLSTPANEGNSGSPVVNKKGEILGVVSSTETNAQGVVYAVKSSHIFAAIEEASKQGGIKYSPIQSKSSIKNLDRISQIKKIQDYIFMIKGN